MKRRGAETRRRFSCFPGEGGSWRTARKVTIFPLSLPAFALRSGNEGVPSGASRAREGSCCQPFCPATGSSSNAAPPRRGCPGGVPPPEEGREKPSLRGARCRRYKPAKAGFTRGPAASARDLGALNPPRWKQREVSAATESQPHPRRAVGTL